METVRLGDPFDPATDLGPWSRTPSGTGSPASWSAPAATPPSSPVARSRGRARRRRVLPATLVSGAGQDSEVVQSEIFGPVLVVLPFDTDDEGIELANDTPYGLAASAWSRDVYRAGRATREIKAGCVWVNDHIPIISEMPHGGYKASGFERT